MSSEAVSAAAFFAGGLQDIDRGWTMQSALFLVRLWIVPVAAVYAFGLGLAWVMRGFHAEAN